MTLKQRIAEYKKAPSGLFPSDNEEALWKMLCIACELLDKAISGLDSLVRHDVAMDTRDSLEHCLELEEAISTLTEIKQTYDGGANDR